jgi:uncharacterized protein (DUF433 family)
MKQQILQTEADALGIPLTELQTRMAAGKTFEQVASDLGITKDQLKTKLEALHEAKIQELVTSGKITQTQADAMLARKPGEFVGRGLGTQSGIGEGKGMMRGGGMGKLNPEHLQDQADALGITVTDLQSRMATGKTFKQIGADLGITHEQLKAKMDAEFKTDVQARVTSGKLTQAQADGILARQGKGFGGGRGGMMRGGGMMFNH